MKFRFFIFAIVLLISLNACLYLDEAGEKYAESFGNGDSEKTEETVPHEEEFALEKKTGTLTRLDGDTLRATHLLTLTGDETVYLRSGAINLRKYEYREVEVEGKFASADQVFEVEDVKKLGNEDAQRSRYRHSRLGVSVSYPSLWEITEKENGIVFTPYAASETELMDRISISKLSNERNLEAEAWLDLKSEDLKSKDPADTGSYLKVVIGPDQLQGIRRISQDKKRADFYIKRENAMYRLTHLSIGDEDETAYRNLFFEMVNSFQFIPLSDALSSITPVAKQEETVAQQTEQKTEQQTETKTDSEPATEPDTQLDSGELTSVMEPNRFPIRMNYPKNWYWGARNDGYSFGEREIELESDVLIHLSKSEGTLQTSDDLYVVCEEAENSGFFYCLSGNQNFKTIIDGMIATFEIVNE